MALKLHPSLSHFWLSLPLLSLLRLSSLPFPLLSLALPPLLPYFSRPSPLHSFFHPSHLSASLFSPTFLSFLTLSFPLPSSPRSPTSSFSRILIFPYCHLSHRRLSLYSILFPTRLVSHFLCSDLALTTYGEENGCVMKW